MIQNKKFYEWAKRRFLEFRKSHPNLVWEPPIESNTIMTWQNLDQSVQVICRKVMRGKYAREVYIDNERLNRWDLIERL